MARAHCRRSRALQCATHHPAAAWWPSQPIGRAVQSVATPGHAEWISSAITCSSPCAPRSIATSTSSRQSTRPRATGDALGVTATGAPAPPPPKQFKVRPITKDDVDFSFARSSGPGGQNVNKLNTKVDMRFQLDLAGWIPEEVKEAIRRAEKNKFTKDGWLVVTSTKHRTQSANMDDALAKLQEIIDAAVEAVTPKEADPETIARVKKNIKAGNERRLDAKKKDSKKKLERRRRDFD